MGSTSVTGPAYRSRMASSVPSAIGVRRRWCPCAATLAVMAKLSSLALLATGLFIMWRGQGSDLAAIGWLFVAVGVLALGFNLYVTVKGPQGPGN